MNILFLTLYDFSSVKEQSIYTDLIREFIKKGHKTYAISPLEKVKSQSAGLINCDGCKILKIKAPSIQKSGTVKKGISTLLIGSYFKKGIKKYFHNVVFDVVIYSTPPITLQKAVAYVKKRDQAVSYLLLKDIFPQNAVDLGILSKNGVRGMIYRFFRRKEKKLYDLSDHIGCMSQANLMFLKKNNPYLPLDKVEVCPNSIDPIIAKKDEETKRKVREKYNIPSDSIVFLYGGNLGKPQSVDFLIECLKANCNNKDIFFVIAGSGTELGKLKAFVNGEEIDNTLLLPYLPWEDYEMLARSCDVGLIFLDKRFSIPNFPSRILSYMQAGLPVIAATDVNSDVGQIIENACFGYWCKSDDVRQFTKNVKQLCDKDLRTHMGVEARKYLEENYTARHSYEIIIEHFK